MSEIIKSIGLAVCYIFLAGLAVFWLIAIPTFIAEKIQELKEERDE